MSESKNKTVTVVNGQGETADLTITPEVAEEAENAGYVKRSAKKTATAKPKTAKNTTNEKRNAARRAANAAKRATATVKPNAPKGKKNLWYVAKKQVLIPKTGKYKTVLRESSPLLINGLEQIKLPPNLEKGATVEQSLADRVIAIDPENYKPNAEK